jgi:hypothetical protein
MRVYKKQDTSHSKNTMAAAVLAAGFAEIQK